MNRAQNGDIIFKNHSIFYYENKSENNWAIKEGNEWAITEYESNEQLKDGLYETIKADLPENDIIVINEEEKKLP